MAHKAIRMPILAVRSQSGFVGPVSYTGLVKLSKLLQVGDRGCQVEPHQGPGRRR